MDYCNDALGAIGSTPLVRLQRILGEPRATVLAKLEFLNPGGSIKDRVAVAMIEHAERACLLRSGGTIVEPTSGNTGAALAMVAAVRGYRCILVVPEKTSLEKIAAMRAYGAEVVVAPNVPPNSPEAYTALAARIARETPGAYMPDQYSNPINPLAHERGTGPEIWLQTRGKITHVVAGLGSGGTLCGIARALKRENRNGVAIGVDPVGSIYSGGMPEPYALEGIGRHYLPQTLDLSVVDRIERVGDRESFAMARRAAREEGLLVGGSSGAALVAADRLARELTDDALVVVLLPDSGQAYLSKFFSEDWLESHGFAGMPETSLGDVLSSRSDERGWLLTSSASLLEAHEAMLRLGIEQLAVIDDDCLVGRVTLHAVLLASGAMHRSLDTSVAEEMGPPFPTVDQSAPVADALHACQKGEPLIVVTRNARHIGALAAHDLIEFVDNRTS